MRQLFYIIVIILLSGYSVIGEEKPNEEATRQVKEIPQHEKAIQQYREKLKENPDDIETHRAYQNLKRKWGAINNLRDEYQKKLKAEPKNPLYHYLYGRLLHGKELENAFNKALELEKESPNITLRFWLYFGLGQFYLDNQQYKEALQNLETALKLKPDNLDVYHQMALLYYTTDSTTRALDTWDTILKIDPDYLDAYLGKGILYKGKGEYDNAIKELEIILKKDSTYWKAYEPLIQCHHVKQNYKKGEELRAKIKELYAETKDNEFKKKYLMIIDIIKLGKRILIAKELINPFRLDTENGISSDLYYFEFYNDKQLDKNPSVVYLYRYFWGWYTLSKGTEIVSYYKHKPFPTYSELLTLIKEIEKSK
ncbi:MAG: tetratricopeptide repeat protein [Planctomycetota bacterium]|nr:tetratricopeptide repeat protein [Planctomycetota bacterium]MDI6787787.1 tetratricopeptide repeat protein [Planctomycetota bacterium]